MTYSIVARDALTGDLAVAVQSKFMCVGSIVPWARAGVGAVATQAFSNVRYGADGLALLASGLGAPEAVERLIAADAGREHRQLAIVDGVGRAQNYTGRGCFAWAGGRIGENVAVQGNILAGPTVVDAMYDTFMSGARPFPELLIQCLVEADRAGGDRRGRESAALLVVRENGAYGGGGDRWMDLRVDDHPDPIGELRRLFDLWGLYFQRPVASDLLPLDETLAAELRHRLASAGYGANRKTAIFAPMGPGEVPEAAAPPVVGEAGPHPAGWDEAWQTALTDWMSVENLEERTAAASWIDPRVLAYLREHTIT